jgi:hypothetical protein
MQAKNACAIRDSFAFEKKLKPPRVSTMKLSTSSPFRSRKFWLFAVASIGVVLLTMTFWLNVVWAEVRIHGLVADNVTGGVEVNWDTSLETDVLVFYVQRGDSILGPFTRFNDSQVSANSFPSSYSYLDRTAVADQAYWYRIEWVDINKVSFFSAPTKNYIPDTPTPLPTRTRIPTRTVTPTINPNRTPTPVPCVTSTLKPLQVVDPCVTSTPQPLFLGNRLWMPVSVFDPLKPFP